MAKYDNRFTRCSFCGKRQDMVERIIQESFHPLMKNNPKEVTVEDLQTMYKELTG